VQLFDSWVGSLSEADYRKFVLAHLKELVGSIKPGVPVIYFGTGTAHLLKAIVELGTMVVGVDWRVPLSEAWQTIGYDKAIPGQPRSAGAIGRYRRASPPGPGYSRPGGRAAGAYLQSRPRHIAANAYR